MASIAAYGASSGQGKPGLGWQNLKTGKTSREISLSRLSVAGGQEDVFGIME